MDGATQGGPSGCSSPGPRPNRGPSRAAGKSEVSAKLMRGLRADYGRGAVNDRGEALGELAEVRAWLESLESRRRDSGPPSGAED